MPLDVVMLTPVWLVYLGDEIKHECLPRPFAVPERNRVVFPDVPEDNAERLARWMANESTKALNSDGYANHFERQAHQSALALARRLHAQLAKHAD